MSKNFWSTTLFGALMLVATAQAQPAPSSATVDQVLQWAVHQGQGNYPVNQPYVQPGYPQPGYPQPGYYPQNGAYASWDPWVGTPNQRTQDNPGTNWNPDGSWNPNGYQRQTPVLLPQPLYK